ncbi:aminotransferase class IV [Parvularcula oceani]|uniref:aminotransferase class IV n=1 Tax=Parvularcula oceani TaxID=1247963 RepID=UPI0004E1E09A|nr:aminotransferase class IV [Parvularcula oceani]
MIWIDGELRPDDAPVLRADDRGALLGDGLFETLKAVGGRPLFLREHLGRMAAAAGLLDLPFDPGAASEGVAAILNAMPGEGLAAVRITLMRGPAPRGVAPVPRQDQEPTLLISAGAMAEPPQAAVRLHLARTVRRNAHSPASRMKTLSYADSLLARAEAAQLGCDDALLLNTEGRPVCTSIGNLWVETPEGFATPPLGEGVLPGIVRQVLLSAAPSRGIRIEERPLQPSEIAHRRLFRSNSLTGVQPAVLDAQAAAGDNPLGALYRALEEEALAR